MDKDFGEFLFCPHDGSEVLAYDQDPNFYFCGVGHHFTITNGQLVELTDEEAHERYKVMGYA